METYFSIVLILAVVAISLFASFWTNKTLRESWESIIDKDLAKKRLEIKSTTVVQTLPIRLQAYERLVLLLERSKTGHLLNRLSESGMPAAVLHHSLVTTLRAEMEHNLSQQIYVGPQAWAAVVNAHQSMLNLTNACFQNCNESSTGIDLARLIFQNETQTEALNQQAISILKAEALQLIS